jgi:hypothetical protein
MDGKLRYRNGSAVLIGLLAAIFFNGCLTPYAIPKIKRTPNIDFDSGKTDVHAFRIEETDFRPYRFLSLPDDHSTCEYDICEIPIEAGAFLCHVSPQYYLCVNRGVGITGVLIGNSGKHVIHEMRVVLYRPGYISVVIYSDLGRKRVDCFDCVAQPEPLDWDSQVFELLSLCSLAKSPRTIPVSSEHRKVLLYLISECERLDAVFDATPKPLQHELDVESPDRLESVKELERSIKLQMRLRSRADELRRLAEAKTEAVETQKN